MRDGNNAVIEDVGDTVLTYKRMLEDSPKLTMISMALKVGVPDQAPEAKRVIAVVKTVNKWLAGAGMNIDFEGDRFYSKDAFREYRALW